MAQIVTLGLDSQPVRFWELKNGANFYKYGVDYRVISSTVYKKIGTDICVDIDTHTFQTIGPHAVVIEVTVEGDFSGPTTPKVNKDNMLVYMNKIPIELRQSNFLASGGQGSIYVKGSTAYKIYSDIKKAIPRDKIAELALLTNDHIIRPMDILENGKGEYIGYTMPFIKNSMPLCQIVPKVYKDRHNIKPAMTLALINQMQSLMEFAHSKNILMIDMNDLNFLVTNKYDELYAIDVDSYQTSRHPALAIMDSIKDRHTKKFSKESDYFSFAVTSFQTLIGLHPYRGNHPDYEKYPIKERMGKRMENNVSVFHSGVSLPGACLPLDIIPRALKEWYVEIFESKNRIAPPKKYAAAPTPTLTIKNVKHDKLKISCVKQLSVGTAIVRLYYMAGRMFEIVNSNQYMAISTQGTPITLRESPTGSEWGDIAGRNRGFFTGVTKLFNTNHDTYGVMGNKLVKLDFVENNNHIMAGIKQMGSLIGNENASNIYDGCIIQNVLGRQTISLINCLSLNQVPLPELDGKTILDAKYLSNVLVVTATDRKTQECNRYVFRFMYCSYDIRTTKDVDPAAAVVFTVSQKGIVILKTDENKLEIFHSSKDQKDMKVVSLEKLEIDNLWNIAGDIMFTIENEIHKISL